MLLQAYYLIKKGIARSLYMMLKIKKTNKDNKYFVKY